MSHYHQALYVRLEMSIVQAVLLIYQHFKVVFQLQSAILIAVLVVNGLAYWRTSPGVATRMQLTRCFREAEICLKRKRKNNDEYRIYPKVMSVKERKDCLEILFKLPVGLSPDLVQKKAYVFRQVFGPEVELNGNDLLFCLEVYQGKIKQFAYKFDDLKPLAESVRLPVIVGKSRQGYALYDMVEWPHLLVSGETGSGKSTFLRALLTFWIQSLAEVHLYLADLKKTEFHLFKSLPHVKANVTDLGAATAMLRKIDKELDRRGELLEKEGVGHVDDYSGHLPYIVVCVDEFALLAKNDKAMEIIQKVSRIGRSLGIFAILSMQRPDAKVLDGDLKNNLTVRLSFKQSNELNSRIAIDESGAEKLRQKGEGLLKGPDGTMRIQAPHLEMEKAKKILDAYKIPINPDGPIDVEFTVYEHDGLLPE